LTPNQDNCHSDCLACTEPDNASACLKCSDPSKMLLNHECVSDCGDRYVNNLGHCQDCPRSQSTARCTSCSPSATETVCNKCRPLTFTYWDEGTFCACENPAIEVDQPFPFNSLVKTCSVSAPMDSCNAGCTSCNGDKQCYSCQSPKKYNPSENSCVEVCPDGTFEKQLAYEVNEHCIPCMDHCDRCVDGITCERCTEGYIWENNF
jgi:hypothetical protein